MKPRFALATTLIAAHLTACHHDPAQEQFKTIRTDIENGQFQNALKTIQTAKLKTSSEYTPILDYNQAVIQIHAGECDAAQIILELLLKNIENHRSEQKHYKASTQHYAQSKLQARLHHALALAILCPTQPYRIPTEQDNETALMHLYQAASLGMNVHDTISAILTKHIKPCQDFIPDNLQKATAPENAINIDPAKTNDIILCSNGLWFKFNARKGEVIKADFTLSPLDRKTWMDESSLLPFTQLHADLHLTPASGHSFETPVFHFEQPLPSHTPTHTDYETIKLSTPDIPIQKTGSYLVHLYTQYNGESRVIIQFAKSLDCGTIDDTITYTETLVQTPVTLRNAKPIQHLMLCPERPDAFHITLDPHQSALITLQTDLPHISQTEFLHYALNTQDGQPLINITPEPDKTSTTISETPLMQGDEPPAALSDGRSHERTDRYAPTPEAGLRPATPQPPQADSFKTTPYYLLFTPKSQDTDNPKSAKQQAFLYIHNPQSTPETVSLALQIGTPHTPMPYSITMAKSHECTDDQETASQILDLRNIEQTQSHFESPIWMCHHQDLHIQPLLPPNTPLIRAKTQAYFLSDATIRNEDFQFASYLQNENDPESRHFIIEEAQTDTPHWTPQNHIHTRTLKKPITAESHLHAKANGTYNGFQILHVQLNEDSSDNTSESQKQNQKTQNEQKKDQKDNANKQNTPNKSPEKPSETPAAPKGPGTDTQGDESTPNENQPNGKASKLDLKEYEKDNIDALLDAIENGNFYVPLSGNKKNTQTDKPW